MGTFLICSKRGRASVAGAPRCASISYRLTARALSGVRLHSAARPGFFSSMDGVVSTPISDVERSS